MKKGSRILSHICGFLFLYYGCGVPRFFEHLCFWLLYHMNYNSVLKSNWVLSPLSCFSEGVLSQNRKTVKTMTFQYWGWKINFIPIHYSHITNQVWFIFPILITLTYRKNSWPWKFWNAVIIYINNTKQNHRKV